MNYTTEISTSELIKELSYHKYGMISFILIPFFMCIQVNLGMFLFRIFIIS